MQHDLEVAEVFTELAEDYWPGVGVLDCEPLGMGCLGCSQDVAADGSCGCAEGVE